MIGRANITAALLLRLTAPAMALDEQYARELYEVCAACHGEFPQGGKGGEYPRLAGLPEIYLVAEQLRNFKRRERKHDQDQSGPDELLAALTPQVLRDLLAYLSGLDD